MPLRLEFRIFLSSPGDVADERALARRVLNTLPKEPQFQGQVHIEEVSWDNPGASTPLDAHLNPQEAIDQRRPKPSECDIVVIVLWARMGTPMPVEYTKPDGGRYVSGTEYEYLDAIEAARMSGKPRVLVYRREDIPELNLKDPERKEKLHQYELVEAFFDGFRDKDGSLRGSYHPYEGPSEFQELLENHLRELIWERLKAQTRLGPTVEAPPETEFTVLWEGNPYRGLSAFNENHAPVFFGRGRETDDLVRRLTSHQKRFVAIIGPSGSGKSSLVAAGLLPRLKTGAIAGSKDWVTVRFTPAEVSDDPFTALAAALAEIARPPGPQPRKLADRLRTDPTAIAHVGSELLEGHPDSAELLLFVDQFEELFTLVGKPHRGPFVLLLAAAARSARLRVILTMRSDFYDQCTQYEPLVPLLRDGSFTVGTPGVGALTEMIERPARAAGLTLESGLTQRILDETSTEPGALPLMEFTLERLYDEARQANQLTLDVYSKIGGVAGAIEVQAEKAIPNYDRSVAESALDALFRALVAVDPEGATMRRRASLADLSDASRELAYRLVSARLLTTRGGESEDATLEVSHETVLRKWRRLVSWVDQNRDFLLWHQRLKMAVEQWEHSGRDNGALLRGGPLNEAESWLAHRDGGLSEDEGIFVQKSIALRNRKRVLTVGATMFTVVIAIGVSAWQWWESEKVRRLRAPIVPEMVVIGPGTFMMGSTHSDMQSFDGERPAHQVTIEKPFAIGKYEVTFAEYDRFAQTTGRLPNDKGWGRGKRPIIFVSWQDANAYAEWLSEKTGKRYRLPAETEWEYAARADSQTRYWWDNQIGGKQANCDGCGSQWDNQKTAPVGKFPANEFGLHDTAGNVWEWVQDCWHDNFESAPKDERAWTEEDGGDCNARVIRGGSWDSDSAWVRSAQRGGGRPDYRSGSIGFRLARDL
jgi:formylglycine-generating enzyme required for sulfatase activity/energy-coupling factor transporter ATP-binding protein EcfA2